MGSPRDWMETVRETVERIKELIGSSDDTGSETTGTVMGKENEILAKVNSIKEDVQKSNRKLIKQTGKKRLTSSAGITVIEFDFPKPVQFISILSELSGDVSNYRNPVYLINGEDSIRTNTFRTAGQMQFLCAGELNGFRNGTDIFSFMGIQADVSDVAPFPYPIYITKIRMEMSGGALQSGSYIDYSVYYIE